MPIVIAPILVALEAVLLALVAYALLRTASAWLRPQLFIAASSGQTKTKSRRWFEYLVPTIAFEALTGAAIAGLKWLGQPIAKAILSAERYVLTALSRYVGAQIEPVARWLHGLAELVHGLSSWSLDLSRETYQALYHLRHVTMPAYVHAITDPIVKAATAVKNDLTALERTITAARIAINAELEGIGRDVVGGIDDVLRAQADALTDLWKYTRGELTRGLNDLRDFTIPVLNDQIGRILDDLYNAGTDSLANLRIRLRDAEDWIANKGGVLTDALLLALGTVAGIAGLTALLTKIAPNLFCRNTNALTKALCGFDASEIDDLLALLGSALVIGNLRETIGVLQSITRETTEAVKIIAEV